MEARLLCVDQDGNEFFMDPCHNYIEGKPVLTIEEAEKIAGRELDIDDYYNIYNMGGTISKDCFSKSSMGFRLTEDGVMDECGEAILTKDAVKYLIDTLQGYYSRYDELYDAYVKEYRERVINFVRENFSPSEQTPNKVIEKSKNGYIYIMLHQGYYKIGKSVDCMRLGEYTKLAEEPEYVYVIYVNDMNSMENKLHKKFKRKRCREGKCEWFKLNSDDLKVAYEELKKEEVKNHEHTIGYRRYVLKEDV